MINTYYNFKAGRYRNSGYNCTVDIADLYLQVPI